MGKAKKNPYKVRERKFERFYQEKLKEISKHVQYNSKLPVEMIISYQPDHNGEAIEGTQKYKIQKITGDLIQETKLPTFFDKNS